MKRPRDAACRSQAICAWTSGLRGNATAMFVPIDDALRRRRGERAGEERIVARLGRPQAVVAELASASRASLATLRRSPVMSPRVDAHAGCLLDRAGDGQPRAVGSALERRHDRLRAERAAVRAPRPRRRARWTTRVIGSGAPSVALRPRARGGGPSAGAAP